MTQHYNRPPLDPVHVYIQPVVTTPGQHTITRSGGASLNANSTSPYADAAAALRAAGERADARHHLGRQQQPDLQGRARRRLSAIKEGPALGRGLESRGGNAQGGRDDGSHILTAGEIMPMGGLGDTLE